MKRLFIDTETTGLSPTKHQVLTLGMVIAQIKDNKINLLDEKHLFIKHKKYNINPFAMRVNKINILEHNKIGLTPKSACKKINSFLENNSLFNTPIVGHNVSFDINFLNSLFSTECLDYPFHIQKEDTRLMWNNLKKQGLINPLYNSKLKTIAEHFQIDYSKAHNALSDCHITAQVYHRLMNLNIPL